MSALAIPEPEATDEDAQEMYEAMADVYDKAAGQAFRDGDYDKALLFIGVCRNMDPTRTALWQEHARRVKSAETQRYSLAELMERRLSRLGRGKDDPAIRQWAEWNHQVQLRNGIEDREAEL